MANKINRTSLKRLNRNKIIWSKFIIIIIFIFLVRLLLLIYLDIKTKDLVTYSYAFFAGNAIAANCLFALGRANIFIEKAKENKIIEEEIFHAGLYFLTAAIIGFILSGISYGNTIGIFESTNAIYLNINFIITSIILSIGAIFCVLGVYNFLKFIIPELIEHY